MQINSIYNTSFQSRNPQIRQADRFLHVVNKEFPAISPSKLTKFNNLNLDNKENYITRKYFVLDDFLAKIRVYYANMKDKLGVAHFYEIFAKALKGNSTEIFPQRPNSRIRRLANCAELADISKMVLGINNIDSILVGAHNFKGNTFVTQLPRNAKHNFILIPDKGVKLSTEYIENTPFHKLKNCLVFDPWCGFVDTPANAALKYFGEHDNLVGKTIRQWTPKQPDNKYYDRVYLSVLGDNNKLDISTQACEQLRQIFPELIVK